MVAMVVMNVSNDAARHASLLLFSQLPVQTPGCPSPVVFELRPSGNLTPRALLHFNLSHQGMVVATTEPAYGNLPAQIPLREIGHQWVKQIAEEVLIAVLEIRGMPIAD